jgi:hypothetical protein
MEWRPSVKLRHKRRRGSAQRSRVAGTGVPQHNQPWLIAFDELADVDLPKAAKPDLSEFCRCSFQFPQIAVPRFAPKGGDQQQ